MVTLIITVITTLLGAILAPFMFAFTMYVPLIITQTCYIIYNVMGMSDFARQLFGSTNGSGVN